MNSFQNIEPTFRCRPDFVHGMPVARETLRLAFVIPTARLQLKPPLFIFSLSCWTQQGPLYGTSTNERAVDDAQFDRGW